MYKRQVLFDEVEKAHPDVFNILLQVLDLLAQRLNEAGVSHFTLQGSTLSLIHIWCRTDPRR